MIKDKKLLSKLSQEQINVCHLAGTESPFSGKYNKFYEEGMYKCAVCDNPLFSSETKFDSGTGWPSFYDAAKKGNVELKQDNSLGMKRTEVICKNCGAHLGHVFEDGPAPTGLRYCINSVSLDFSKDKSK